MSDTFLQRTRKKFEDTFHPANLIAGVCESYTLDEVRDLLDHAANLTDRAKTTATFAEYSGLLGSAADKLVVATQKLDKLAKAGQTRLGDVKAACQIADAVSVLNKWSGPNSEVSAQEAAKAFDQLFGGAANFFKKLPPPFNEYARILSGIAEFSFFSNMQKQLDPESPYTPRGRQMREVLDTIDGKN